MDQQRILQFSGIVLLALILSSLSFSFATAQEGDEEDLELFGLELEKLLFLLNAWIALFLFVIIYSAYKRDGRERLLYVSIAFLIFAIKSFLLSLELFISPPAWIDPSAAVLEFFVLLSFFYGVIKKS